MGDWRTVHLVGSMDPGDDAALREFLTPLPDRSDFGPLSIVSSLRGLGDWPAAQIDTSGNLAERDYSVHDVYDALWPLVVVAPSLRLQVHCGGDNEDTRCVATITVEDGQVFEHEPEVETVPGVSISPPLGVDQCL